MIVYNEEGVNESNIKDIFIATEEEQVDSLFYFHLMDDMTYLWVGDHVDDRVIGTWELKSNNALIFHNFLTEAEYIQEFRAKYDPDREVISNTIKFFDSYDGDI